MGREGEVDAPGRISLWGVEVFVATVEAGSISVAADRLSTSASTVSQQLSNLEGALGARLVDRSGRPLKPTPAGRLFLRRCQRILSEAAQARAELAVHDLSQLARLRLGMIEDLDAEVTPRLLTTLAAELPGCQFRLETGYSLHLANALDGRDLDMVVAADLDLGADWAEVHSLMREPFLLAAPKGRFDAAPTRRDLLDMPMIRYSVRQIMGRQIEAHLAREHFEPPHRFELDSYHAIMALVADGAGWAMTTPLGYMRARRFHGAVDLLPSPFAPLSRDLVLMARKDTLDDLPGRVAALVAGFLQAEIVDACLADMPWLKGHLVVHGR